MSDYYFKLNDQTSFEFNLGVNIKFNIFVDPSLFENKDLIKIFEGILLFFDKIRITGQSVIFRYNDPALQLFLKSIEKNIFVSRRLYQSTNKGMIYFIETINTQISFEPNLLIWDGLGQCGTKFIYNNTLLPNKQKFWIINTFTETIYDSEFYRQQLLIENISF